MAGGTRRASFGAIALSIALTAAPAPAQDWFEYRSDNFTVFSDVSEREARQTIENFEVFRQIALLMLGLEDRPENEHLRIVMYDRTRDFNRIRPEPGVAGFFYHSVFGPRMIVSAQWHADTAQRTLFHEYVHHLMNSRSAINYPRWYFEGLAELLGSADFSSPAVVVGRPPPFAPFNQFLSFSELIDNVYDDPRTGFYPMSWMLVHYLLIGSIDEPERKRQTVEYVRRYDAGEDPIEAFTESFGISPADMQREINAYMRLPEYLTVRFSNLSYDGDIVPRAFEPGESLYLMGDIAVELSEYEAAYDYFDEFAEADIDSDFGAKVQSRRAIAHVHERAFAAGDALVEPLIENGIADPDVLADLAHYAYDRFVFALQGDGEIDPGQLERALDFGQQAVAAAPGDLEAVYYLGLSHELNGNIQLAADTLLASYDINPSVPALNLALARVLIRGRQVDLASYLLDRVYSATHSDELRERIRNVQTRIADPDFDVSRIGELL